MAAAVALSGLSGVSGLTSAHAAEPQPAAASRAQADVFTRARVNTITQEADGSFLIRLKIPPRSKIPFTTQTFKVQDKALLMDIPEGAWVKFKSQHIDGANVVTAIHVVAECVRFQRCD